MYCLREFAKHYYDRFHSPQRMYTESGIGWLVATLLSLFLLFTYFAAEKLITSPQRLGFGVNMGLALVMEFLWLSAQEWAKHISDKKNIEFISRITGKKCNSISQARMFYLKGWLEKESLYIGETLNNINMAIGFIDSDGYFFTARPKALSELIFSQNAKPRLVSLFIALSALILTLGVSGGTNLGQVFAFYDSDLLKVVGLYVVTTLLLLGVYLAVSPFFFWIQGGIRWTLSMFFNKEYGGVEVLRIFARDLMFYASDSLYENGGEAKKAGTKGG